MQGKVIRRVFATIASPLAALILPPWQVLSFDVPPDIIVPIPTHSSLITEEVTENIGNPVRIVIPSISVDAAIQNVALTKFGAMDLAKDPLETSWYELGALPGTIGSAVIAGHVNWYNHEKAVFENLHDISPGDSIHIIDDTNTTISFIVREVQSFSATANAESVFLSDDGKSHLNLITCEGVWNGKSEQFTNRFVVFADRQSIELSQ